MEIQESGQAGICSGLDTTDWLAGNRDWLRHYRGLGSAFPVSYTHLDVYKRQVVPDGITVYFMQYDIAPYAAGSLTVKLPYDGNEEMFANRLFVNENRVNPVAAYETTYVNVGGVRKALRLENVLENETYNNTVHIYLNDSEVSVDVEYGCSASYLIQKENGQQFLYLESKSDNDYRILHVVDLNQEMCIRDRCWI